MYNEIRSTLRKYYFEELPSKIQKIKDTVFSVMDKYYEENPTLSAYKLKAKMYDAIVNACEPKIIEGLPFCFDTGTLYPTSDGRYRYIDSADGITKNERIISHSHVIMRDRIRLCVGLKPVSTARNDQHGFSFIVKRHFRGNTRNVCDQLCKRSVRKKRYFPHK